jgi:hypothetical protein
MAASKTRELDALAVKHLDYVQTVINRLSHELFAYKGWAVTLSTLIFATAAASGKAQIVPIAILPALAFWGLDAFYLRQQRLYRALYDAVRDGSADALEGGPLSMDVTPYVEQVPVWWRTLIAKSVAVPYGMLVVLTWLVIAFTFP